ncbi:MAG: hypothetical protein SGJ27_13995 [Candidatus Melainabacteria bacterium]|nr:hypothetical protein [Candidatus Melainabacteria bacterium]
MRKSQSNSKRLPAAMLSAMLLLSTCNPGVCQTSSGDPLKSGDLGKGAANASDSKSTDSKPADVKPPAPNSKSPESDSRSASDTVWSLDSKLEKKVEQELDKPGADPQMPSGDDVLNSLKDQFPKVAIPSSQGPSQPATQSGSQPASTSATADPTKNLGPTTVDPAKVLMKAQPDATKSGTGLPSTAPQNNQGVTFSGTQPSAAGKAAAAAEKDKPINLSSGTLTGRIEQISGEGDVRMPVLKTQAAVLDPRGKLLPAEIEKYSGTIAKSFPTDFRGVWGGNMQIWSYRYSPDYLVVDRAEAISSANVLKAKRSGAVNFNFHNDARTGQVALEPATVLLTVPIKDTNTFAQMAAGGGGGQMGQFGGMFNQMMGNMEAPVIGIHFGKASANSMERGVSGNDFNQVVAKNVIRMLGPGVLEQQIVTKFTTKTPGGKTNSGFDESVMRFKKLDNNRLYVLCAAVKYGHTGKYLSKLIMYGTVDRNRRMDTNPMGNMNSMMGGMMNMGDMQKMMNGMAGQGGGGPVKVPQGGVHSLPGMGGLGGTGGLNGAGGLNDILKQLNQLQNKPR